MDSILGLFPLNTVLVPGASLRLHVFEDRYKLLMASCMQTEQPFGVLLSRNGNEVGDDLDPAGVGTAAVVTRASKLGTGRLYVLAKGLRRFKVERIVDRQTYWRAEISYLGEDDGSRDALRLRDAAVENFKCYLKALMSGCDSDLDSIQLPAEPCAASYVIADAMQLDCAVKQALLEAPSTAQRLRAEVRLLSQEIERLGTCRQPALNPLGARRTPFSARFSSN